MSLSSITQPTWAQCASRTCGKWYDAYGDGNGNCTHCGGNGNVVSRRSGKGYGAAKHGASPFDSNPTTPQTTTMPVVAPTTTTVVPPTTYGVPVDKLPYDGANWIGDKKAWVAYPADYDYGQNPYYNSSLVEGKQLFIDLSKSDKHNQLNLS